MADFFKRLCGLSGGASSNSCDASQGRAQPRQGFVSVDGFQFQLDGSRFPVVGANCYYLMTRAANDGVRHEVVEALDACAQLGLTVVRTWAFNDGCGWNALQTQPNEYDERVFVGLDQVVAWCGERGLRLMLTLTNYWKDYGGMQQYVRWSRGIEGEEEVESELFYGDKKCIQMFKQFVSTVLNRTNTITGIQYKDDPTIMAWDICNEPRSDGNYRKIKPFLRDVSAFIRSIDPHHLITFGAEGFFGPSSVRATQKVNPAGDDNTGCDFTGEYMLPCLDFACIHMWQCQWRVRDQMDHAKEWITKHVEECQQTIRKPLVIQEFGTKPRGEKRAAFYQQVFDAVEEGLQNDGAAAGSVFWMVAARSYEDYDGYTVYMPDADGQTDDGPTLAVIQQHVQKIKAICV